MVLVSIVLLIAFLVSIAGIVYPFRPFRTRKRAFIALGVSLVAIMVLAPKVESEDQVASAMEPAVEVPATESGQPAEETSSETADRAATRATEERARQIAEREEKIRTYAETLQWKRAREEFDHLRRSWTASEEFTAKLEATVIEMVRPLPASERELNLAGYRLLAVLRPEDGAYSAKVDQYEKAIETHKAALIGKFRKKEDKVEGITFYQHPNEPKYLNSRSTVYLYIGRKGNGRPWLRMKVQYAAENWLFVERVDAWYLGVKEPLVVGGFNRDNNSRIWEWVDIKPDDYQLEVLRALAKAPESILRFQGQQYHRDVTLSAGDKKAIAEVLEAYDLMLGNS